MRDYTPFMYDLSKCIKEFYCHIQLIRTKFLKILKEISENFPNLKNKMENQMQEAYKTPNKKTN